MNDDYLYNELKFYGHDLALERCESAQSALLKAQLHDFDLYLGADEYDDAENHDSSC